MRMLFEIDTKDYDINGSSFSRPSARGIIIKNGKAAMIYSQKYNYYKFPGGGIEADEKKIDALVREVLEETGLCVILDTVQEYGQVHCIQKGDFEDVFIQDNYYFLCDVETNIKPQNLDAYEADEGFTLDIYSWKDILKIRKSEYKNERKRKNWNCLLLKRTEKFIYSENKSSGRNTFKYRAAASVQ